MVYVRYGSTVTVIVENGLPFETLTMDLKKTTEKPGVDEYQNGFTTLSTALGGLQVFGATIIGAPPPANDQERAASEQADKDRQQALKQACPDRSGMWSHDQIEACQKEISSEFAGMDGKSGYKQTLKAWSTKAVCMTHPLFVPLPSDLVMPTPPQPKDPPKGCSDSELKLQFPGLRQPLDTRPIVVVPTGDLTQWKADFIFGYGQIQDLPVDLTSKLKALDGNLADSKGKTLRPDEYLTLNSAESDIHTGMEAYATLEARMKGLHDAVDQMQPAPANVTFAITQTTAHKGNITLPVWDLNSSNKLAQIAARVKADKYPDDFTLNVSALTDVPAKQTVAEYTIQFMSTPRFEIAGGIVVPIKPYHSYSVQTTYGAATGGGACPPSSSISSSSCGTVAYTPTTTFIPAAMGSVILGHEYTRPGFRFAVLATGVAGYNTASTSAAFGGGLSLSFGSFVLSGPIMWDRTQQLTGGYQVGQSAGAATAPTTKNVWAWSPAIGISVRLPLGGSSQ